MLTNVNAFVAVYSSDVAIRPPNSVTSTAFAGRCPIVSSGQVLTLHLREWMNVFFSPKRFRAYTNALKLLLVLVSKAAIMQQPPAKQFRITKIPHSLLV